MLAGVLAHDGNFYPRSPCGERPNANLRRHSGNHNFYPRSPCGERRNGYPHTRRRDAISIHALLAESDIISTILCLPPTKFLSTLSLRRATFTISRCLFRAAYFYPRSPCGERPPIMTREPAISRFLSTLSLRRATRFHAADISVRRISIHALLAESDIFLFLVYLILVYFYPRSPCGERLGTIVQLQCILGISIHALLAESDVPY